MFSCLLSSITSHTYNKIVEIFIVTFNIREYVLARPISSSLLNPSEHQFIVSSFEHSSRLHRSPDKNAARDDNPLNTSCSRIARAIKARVLV